MLRCWVSPVVPDAHHHWNDLRLTVYKIHDNDYDSGASSEWITSDWCSPHQVQVHHRDTLQRRLLTPMHWQEKTDIIMSKITRQYTKRWSWITSRLFHVGQRSSSAVRQTASTGAVKHFVRSLTLTFSGDKSHFLFLKSKMQPLQRSTIHCEVQTTLNWRQM